MHKNINILSISLLIPFCSVVSHTVLPVPPTVVLFVLSVILALSSLPYTDFKVNYYNKISSIPLLLCIYLLLSQLIIGVEFRALISPCLAPLYFVLTLFLLQTVKWDIAARYIDKFIFISLWIFIIECLWRLSHPSLPEGVEEINPEQYSRWYYWFKGAGLMYIETNGLAIHIIVVYFFTLWWSKVRQKRWLLVKASFLILLFLTFSRAAIISVPIGWYYCYSFCKKSINSQLLIVILASLSLLCLFPLLFSFMESDPSTLEKLNVFKKIIDYYSQIDLFSLVYGIGNYNSKVAFGTYAHNYLLVFLVEMGLIGLLLILLQFYIFIKYSRGNFLYVFVPFFVQIMSSTIIFIPYFYMIAAIMVYYSINIQTTSSITIYNYKS